MPRKIIRSILDAMACLTPSPKKRKENEGGKTRSPRYETLVADSEDDLRSVKEVEVRSQACSNKLERLMSSVFPRQTNIAERSLDPHVLLPLLPLLSIFHEKNMSNCISAFSLNEYIDCKEVKVRSQACSNKLESLIYPATNEYRQRVA